MCTDLVVPPPANLPPRALSRLQGPFQGFLWPPAGFGASFKAFQGLRQASGPFRVSGRRQGLFQGLSGPPAGFGACFSPRPAGFRASVKAFQGLRLAWGPLSRPFRASDWFQGLFPGFSGPRASLRASFKASRDVFDVRMVFISRSEIIAAQPRPLYHSYIQFTGGLTGSTYLAYLSSLGTTPIRRLPTRECGGRTTYSGPKPTFCW